MFRAGNGWPVSNHTLCRRIDDRYQSDMNLEGIPHLYYASNHYMNTLHILGDDYGQRSSRVHKEAREAYPPDRVLQVL